MNGTDSFFLVGSLQLMLPALLLTRLVLFCPCRFPGKFDLFFNSHQVFHVCIVLAAYAHYLAVVEAMNWRYAI